MQLTSYNNNHFNKTSLINFQTGLPTLAHSKVLLQAIKHSRGLTCFTSGQNRRGRCCIAVDASSEEEKFEETHSA
jgi:hypothetical protein